MKVIKILLNTFLGLVLIIIWSRFVNLGEIFQTISKVSLLGLMPVFLFMLASSVIRAIRLQFFLSEIKKISLLDLIYLNGASQMLNFLIPIRMGEIAKGVYLNTKYGLHLGKSVVWVFLDRFVDFLAVLALASLLLVIIPTSLSITIITIIIVILAFALALTYLAVFQTDFSKKLVQILMPLLIEKHIKIYF